MGDPARLKGAEFILIEDDPGDVLLIKESFRSSRFDHSWAVFDKGEDALDYLRKRPAPHRAASLILLDLNLPGMDGREVLLALKTDIDLRRIPVVVLTTSDSPIDIKLAYERYANSYITKPSSLDRLLSVAKRIEEYWLETVRLPQ